VEGDLIKWLEHDLEPIEENPVVVSEWRNALVSLTLRDSAAPDARD
jgi:hypothetical protein